MVPSSPTTTRRSRTPRTDEGGPALVDGDPGERCGSAGVGTGAAGPRYHRGMGIFLPSLLAFVVFLGSAALDPRKVRTGVYLLVALTTLVMTLLGRFVQKVGDVLPNSEAQAWVLLVLIGVVALSVVVLGVLLVLNGLTVVRKEGRSPAHLLSLILGVVILAYLVAGILSVVWNLLTLFAYLLFLALPLGWCGFGLVAYLLWSWLYGRLTRRFGRPVDAVVVLGAGLRGAEVTPLLAARVDRGVEWAHRGEHDSDRPVLVMSGGQGPDEEVPEARAMALHARSHRAAGDEVLEEDASRTTEENLRNSARLLSARGEVHRVAVVTSSFHAFRAALLMRRLRIPGYTVGARTARYYWPTAVLREYVAIMRDNLWINVIGLALSILPVVASLVVTFN